MACKVHTAGLGLRAHKCAATRHLIEEPWMMPRQSRRNLPACNGMARRAKERKGSRDPCGKPAPVVSGTCLADSVTGGARQARLHAWLVATAANGVGSYNRATGPHYQDLLLPHYARR